MLRSAVRLRGGGAPIARCCGRSSNRPAAVTASAGRRLQSLGQQRRSTLCALANHSDSRDQRDTTPAHPHATPRRYHGRLSNVLLPPSSSLGGGGGGGVGGILVGFKRIEPEHQLVAGSRRQLSTRRGLPPRRTLPEKIFAGAVVVVLAAWGLLFGAVTLVLLPFIGIGLFLLRRNFQRGGISREFVAKVARKVAERQGQHPAGGGGVVSGGGGGGSGGLSPTGEWMQRAPTQGVMSSLLARMLGGGIRGMELVTILRSEVKRRALRHPGLSSALGGDIGSFSDVEMSTVGTSGGTFGSGGSSSGSGGGKERGGPSRVIKARFRFVGRRGGEGWAEVNVSDWEDDAGEDGTGGIEYDRVFVTLDNGKKFDLTNDLASGDGGGNAIFSRRRGHPAASGKARKKGSKKEGGERPVEAEFRDK